MTKGNAEKQLGHAIASGESHNAKGYLVEYEDGYQSWSPKAVFEEAKTEYCWYVAQAQNSIMNVSLDERQSISNAIHRIMLNDDFHYRGFQNLSDQEQSRNIR